MSGCSCMSVQVSPVYAALVIIIAFFSKLPTGSPCHNVYQSRSLVARGDGGVVYPTRPCLCSLLQSQRAVGGPRQDKHCFVDSSYWISVLLLIYLSLAPTGRSWHGHSEWDIHLLLSICRTRTFIVRKSLKSCDSSLKEDMAKRCSSYVLRWVRRPRGDTLLEISTPARTSAGYQRYMIRISREFSQISIKYLTDFSRISKNISWIYLDISQISVDSSQSCLLYTSDAADE